MTLYVGSNKIKDVGTHGVYVGSQNTNCLTYVPKNINLTLSNGTLTLKAGSKVYVPNGVGVFNEYITQSDISITDSLPRTMVLFVNNSGANLYYDIRDTYSGDTQPSFGQFAVWYDTRNNIIKATADSGSSWYDGWSLPICIMTSASTNSFTSIDQIFDWCGFIGSTAFVLPGVKCLIPNGFKTDGTYNSIEYTVPSVQIATRTWNLGGTTDKSQFIVLKQGENAIWFYNVLVSSKTEPSNPANYTLWHNTSTNEMYYFKGGDGTTFKKINWIYAFWCGSQANSTKITSLTPATVQPSMTAIPIKSIYNGSQLVYQYNSYEPYKVLCNISNSASASVIFKKGVYYIRGQGGGGGGGRNGYLGNGQGGGSGAGFEGYIYVKRDLGAVSVSAGIGGAEAYDGNPGTDTVVGHIMTLGGGKGGAGENKEHIANAGIYTFNSSDDWEIVSYKVARNGEQGLEATSSGDFVSGGNSVLTNSGGGKGHANATAPGAGGGGGFQWNIEGGNGYFGELLIQYISYEPDGGEVTNLEYFKTPTLTGSITPVAEGNIVVTSSYNNTSSWNNKCNNSYIMRNTISTTTDSGYWQMNGSNTQWLQIKFPYKLLIKGMTIASRPENNYTGTVTAYTNADKTVKMGSVTTNKAATNFTLTNMKNGAFVTDTIYLYITNMDTWYGLQNLQIRGYKILDNSISY